MAENFDIALIGAGIVGLATARALSLRYPKLKLVILEKENSIAKHQTSHNSGVIHSGVYYKPGSAKAKLCVEGVKLLNAFCAEKEIPIGRTGKVIVATEPFELEMLDNLKERGIQNGLENLKILSSEELKEHEPHVRGLSALHIPSTAIVDFPTVAKAIYDEVAQLGVESEFSFEVSEIKQISEGFEIKGKNGRAIKAKHVISCGGLYSDRLSKMAGGTGKPKIVPFRGDYLKLKKEKHYLIKGNVYPVPNPSFPFLGVHFTPTMSGEIILGPNAVLAFRREGYRFSDIHLGELWESLTYSGFLRLSSKYFVNGMKEMVRDVNHSVFVNTLRRYVPEIQNSDCEPGPSGVRAQALSEDGSLVDDFIFDEKVPGALFVVNAPSPAATASLAIGNHIANKASENFSLEAK